MGTDLAKLRQCVLLLSSEHDGEVVAAARAINRVLGGASLDWHWLAERVAGGAPEPADWEARVREAYELGRKSAMARGPLTVSDHQRAAEWILDRYDLREKEHDFLMTMSSWRGRPTEKQQAWLDTLCDRYGYQPS